MPRPLPRWPKEVEDDGVQAWFGRTVGYARPERDLGLAIGRALGEVIFGLPEVEALFGQTRGVASAEGSQVLVRLMAAPGDVAGWPWELLIDPNDASRPLTLARDAHVVRAARARTYPIRQEPIQPPLNLLLVLSSPLRSGPAENEAVFDLYQEKRALLGELRPLEDGGLLRVVVEDRPSLHRLRRRIGAQRRGFHLLHFLGHAQPAGLKLEDRLGRGRLVPSHAFSELLQQIPDLRLAVFAGCETARAERDEAGAEWPGHLSTADFVVRDASPTVIGMQAVLPFPTERTLTRFFYQALTAGHSLAEALRLARWAIWGEETVGTDLIDWAVPTMFVGGSTPGPVVDPTVKAVPPRRARRSVLRVGIRQSDLRFFARQNDLRQAIDVLSGEQDVRLLVISGPARVGKTRLLDRALEELDPRIAQLHLSAQTLAGAEDPLRELARLVSEVLRGAGVRAPARGRRKPDQWWSLLVEQLTRTPFVLALDGADLLAEDHEVIAALGELTRRRGMARVVVSQVPARSVLSGDLAAQQWRTIDLTAPPSWPDVWQWIRRNLPALTRVGERRLVPFYSDLGAELERWEQLARALLTGTGELDEGLLEDAVRELSRVEIDERPAPPPLFGAASKPVRPVIKPLRVAVPGPHTSGREIEFARSITRMAAEYEVAGRVVGGNGGRDEIASLARLLPMKSPFADGVAQESAILEWLDAAMREGLDLLVLDYGSQQEEPKTRKVLERIKASGVLLLAAGGNTSEDPPKATYPAWYPSVLAIGALEGNAPTFYSAYDAKIGKPDLYAPQSLGDTPLAEMVTDCDARGTSFSAIYAAAAAVLVWATYRALTAREVREILTDTATPSPADSDRPVPKLDLGRALERARKLLILDVLERGRMNAGEVLAESGLPSTVALPLLDSMVENRDIRLHREGEAEEYENPLAIYRMYELVRREAPSSDERTGRLEGLLAQARRLASRGRFETTDVGQLWGNGGPGQRVVALGVMQALPHTRSWQRVRAAMSEPLSGFEQYHALRLAEDMAGDLDAAESRELLELVERVGESLPSKATDRPRVIARLRAKLDHARPSSGPAD